MLKRVADRLVLSGFDSLTVNVHHFASQIVDYVSSGALNADDINISDESERLLDTGEESSMPNVSLRLTAGRFLCIMSISFQMPTSLLFMTLTVAPDGM